MRYRHCSTAFTSFPQCLAFLNIDMIFEEHPFQRQLWSLGAIITAFVIVRRIFGVSRDKLPPGPKGWPLIGNVLELHDEMWHTFSEWKKIYGPLTYISLAGQPVLILNTHKATSDLLDHRSSIYSDRARFIVASEIASHNLLLPLTRYGDLWRKMRRAAHEGLHKGSISRFHPMQEKEAVHLTHGLLSLPDSWNVHFRRTSASFVSSIVYDNPPLKSVEEMKTAKDPIYQYVSEYNERMGHASSIGSYFVEFFTWMKYIPSFMAKWKRDAEGWWALDQSVFEGWYGNVDKNLKEGSERPSFSASLILGKDRFGLSTTESSYLAGTMFVAGTDTTSAVMEWFLHSMVVYPEIQKKAQAEIDAIVGRSRMPSFADEKNLPYVRALVQEVLRFVPVTPLSVPHATTQDDWYLGYFIPKGTICLPNVWAMNRDPEIYGADAGQFNPSRHLASDGVTPIAPAETKGEGHVTYGFGKRVCIGRHAANNTLFINFATILWALSIAPGRDVDGNVIIPGEDILANEIVVRPKPFPCTITPRFSEVETLLANSKELDL